jgi:hypothetical protein
MNLLLEPDMTKLFATKLLLEKRNIKSQTFHKHTEPMCYWVHEILTILVQRKQLNSLEYSIYKTILFEL